MLHMIDGTVVELLLLVNKQRMDSKGRNNQGILSHQVQQWPKLEGCSGVDGNVSEAVVASLLYDGGSVVGGGVVQQVGVGVEI